MNLLKRNFSHAIIAYVLVLSFSAQAHLCNDVFDQAKDDLAVKVDIRDGQLRIAKESDFKVYLLNTMDRDIAQINLSVESDAFTAEVKPSPTWKSYPNLKTANKGGKKEYFQVTLKRKQNLPDGKYKINLVLFNPQDKREFKTLELEKAADLQQIPKSKPITVDGNCSKTEWDSSLLCSSFYNYKKDGKYFSTSPSKSQPRFRFLSDGENLYLMANVDKDSETTLYIAPDADSSPVKISFDSNATKISSSSGSTDKIVMKKSDKGEIEAKIPFSELGIQNPKRFLANMSVNQGDNVAFWRGNRVSVDNPVVYAEMVTQ